MYNAVLSLVQSALCFPEVITRCGIECDLKRWSCSYQKTGCYSYAVCFFGHLGEVQQAVHHNDTVYDHIMNIFATVAVLTSSGLGATFV